jgi:two-component system sensor kinase
MRRMGSDMVLYGVRADGEEFPLEASISHTEVNGDGFLTVIVRDITVRLQSAAEIARANRQLRELYRQMHDVREAERIRIARELHDELAQWLTALKMDVAWLAGRLPPDETRMRDKLAQMKDIVNSTVTSVRRIATDLRPVMLDDLGLVPAIEHLLHLFSSRTGIVVGLDAAGGGGEFRDPLATGVYRMVQEALTNVARHARATEARVSIAAGDGRLVVRVRDNGVGIEDARLHSDKSFGILGIVERAHTLGGVAQIRRVADGGTLVEISLPLLEYTGAERVS